MVFDSARKEGFPTHYKDQHTAANTDVLFSGIICAIIILSFSLLIIIPAFSGWKAKLKLLVQMFVAIFVGSVIITGNYGHNWEVGKVKIASPYKAATSEEIRGDLAIHIALRGVNITLKGEAINATSQLAQEIIDYNEHFSWQWAQGRFGFGYYAGRFSRDFRGAVLRGSPFPILQLAEYFTFDGEGLSFGRNYRLAGWYAHMLMWAAFPAWIISLIFFRTAVNLGAVMMTLTGTLQLIAIIIWATLRNSLDIKVPFESADQTGEILLSTKYGSDFYLVLANSLLCIVGGIVLLIVNLFLPEDLCNLLDIDVQTLYKDVVLSQEEWTTETSPGIHHVNSENGMELHEMENNSNPGPSILPISSTNETDEGRVVIRRKRVSSYLGKRKDSHRVIRKSYSNVNPRKESTISQTATTEEPGS